MKKQFKQFDLIALDIMAGEVKFGTEYYIFNKYRNDEYFENTFDAIEDILKKWGLLVQGTKFNLNAAKKSFNTLERYLQQNITSGKEQSKFNEEFDRLYNALAKYFLIEETEETGETQYEENNN